MEWFPGQWCSVQSGAEQEENKGELFNRWRGQCTAQLQYTRSLWHLLLWWEGTALIMLFSIIKLDSDPMFFVSQNEDFKWIFYIYRVNRRCVLLGQPGYRIAKQPKSHVHVAHVLCNTQAKCLHQHWVCTHPHRLLAHSSAPRCWLQCHGTCQCLTHCLPGVTH